MASPQAANPDYYDEMGHPKLTVKGASRYLLDRIPSLKPPMDPIPNPFKLLAMLDGLQWLQFSCAFCAWSWDSFDFFSVSLTVDDLGETFNKSATSITWGITLVLMFRSVGAVVFGIASDRWGHGNVAAMALEDCPPEARGIVSGMLQQGYAFGYLLATAFARALVNTTSHGWRPLYWFGACPPVLFIAFRLCLPETKAYQERERFREENGNIAGTFIEEGKVALKRHWMVLLYMILIMAGFNFMSHGSQDLYPTLLKNQYKFSPNAVTVTQIVSNLGAIAGGTVVGYVSQSLGRRFCIIVMSIIGGALLYPYTFVSSEKIMAAAFFEQFCVQGAWGVVPIYLMELSPGSFRTFVVGSAYQLGNLVSSASSTIETTIGERFPLPPTVKDDGTEVSRYKYGTVMCIFMGCVYGYVIILALLGPENKGSSFDAENDRDLAEVAAHTDADLFAEKKEEPTAKQLETV
ncbi:hypothetical protein KEM56_001111 [Ascosphaera pollenicola]|nr:hypothetical protein KEM56_001111 [Ascosphaera pollenicola]